MSQQLMTCEMCGAESDVHEMAATDHKHPCEETGSGRHAWTDNPLGKVLGDVRCTGDLEVHEYFDNDDWQWIEVRVLEYDRVTASEMLSNIMNRHDFKFLGLDDDPEIVRFNRKK